jgi:hypothetical protein
VPEIQELLERTTPKTTSGFDVADLARRGRRRRQRSQVGTRLGAVALLAAAVAGIGVLAPDGDQGQVVATRPPVGELAEAFAASDVPLGTWEQVAQPPFSTRMGSFTGTASDGRVVVWGGSPSADGGGVEGGGVLTDGGVYDSESGAWEAIPAAPVPPGVSFHGTQLKGDRLMVLGSTDGARLTGAVYDLDALQWTEIDSPPTIELPAEGIAWTGETLALVRFWSGAGVDTEAKYREPVVERWSYETGDWELGTSPPLSSRFGASVAFDGERLGVWGGSRRDVAIGAEVKGEELVGDGAIYDVAEDRWEPMAAGPLPPMMQGTAVWLESGRLAVAGGSVEDLSGDEPVMGSGITGMHLLPTTAGAVFDPTSQRWSPLPEPPQDRSKPQQAGTFVIEASGRSLTATDLQIRSSGPTSYYDEITQSWLPAPLPNIHTIDGTLVATSRTRGGSGDDPFKVQVLAGSVWEPATEAPFVNRMDAGVTVVGGDLLVVGGAEGPILDVTGDAWILRFDQ